MIQYLVRRLLWSFVLLVAITMITYNLFFLIPTQPGTTGSRRSQNTTNLRESLLVSGPIYKEYGQFVWRVGHGSFGESWSTSRNVNEVILEAAPVTLWLVLGGAVFWLMLAIPIGILSALRPRSLLDRSATIFVLIGIAAHPVWLGLILSYFLGYRLQIFPITGYCDLWREHHGICNGVVQWSWHLFLPWLTFAMLYAALYSRMIRASVLETMSEDYVRTARAKGASSWRVLRAHVLRNAMIPVVTMLGMDVGIWITNAVFIETVFGLPGVGKLLTTSLLRRDLPVVMAITVFLAVLIIVLNMLVDLLYAALDPRVRAGDGQQRVAGGRAPARTEPVATPAQQPG